MKIEIGKMYRVTGGMYEGDVVKITNKRQKYGVMRYHYESFHNGSKVCHWFYAGSNFAGRLEPIEEETKGAKEMKVVILRDGNTVTAAQYIDGVEVNTGAAKCNPEDSFDFGIGAKLALKRLFKFKKPSMTHKETLFVAPLEFDWDKFTNGEVFVQVSRKTIDDFLKRCEDLNFECVSGKRPTEFNLFRDYDAADEMAKIFFRAFGLNPGENIWLKTVGKKLALTTKAPESEKAVFKW